MHITQLTTELTQFTTETSLRRLLIELGYRSENLLLIKHNSSSPGNVPYVYTSTGRSLSPPQVERQSYP